VFLPTVFVDVDRRYSRRWPTLAITHSLSLSLLLFVLFPFDIKTHLPQMLVIIEIQDSVVFGCSHFIGSTNTKQVNLHQKSVMRSTPRKELFLTTLLLVNNHLDFVLEEGASISYCPVYFKSILSRDITV